MVTVGYPKLFFYFIFYFLYVKTEVRQTKCHNFCYVMMSDMNLSLVWKNCLSLRIMSNVVPIMEQ